MPTTDRWTRFFFYRKEVLKTTWTFRLLVLASVLLLPWITRGLWAGALGKGLLCEEQGAGTGVDAIVVENFDVNYLVFERASELKRKGLTARVLVPVQAAPDTGEPDLVFGQIAELMGRTARIGELTMIPVRASEPISLNTAYRVRDFLR